MRTPIVQKNGFTLMELMVAIVIAVLVVSLMLQIVSAILSQADRSIGQLSRESELQSAFTQIESDLQNLFWVDGMTGFIDMKMPDDGWGDEGWESVPNDCKPTVQSISMSAPISSSMLDERWGKYGVLMKMMVNNARKGSEDPGGVYAVSYQIKRKKEERENRFPRYYLMRAEVSANVTFHEGYRFDGNGFEQGNYDEHAVWAAGVIRHPNQYHILASHIIDFGVRVYARSQTHHDWELLFPVNNGSDIQNVKPELIVVMLRVLSDKGAEMIENVEQNRIDQEWWEIAQQYSTVLTRKVLLTSSR